MRKDEVEFHRLGYGYDRVPAVNVKVYSWPNAATVELVKQHNTVDDPRFTLDWINEREDDLQWTFEAACEQGWEQLQSEAEYIYGPGAKVYSEGRSGGWAYVDRLPDFETWDAIELSKWARFAKVARLLADDIPYQMVSLALFNAFEPWADEQRKLLTGPSFEAVA